MKPSQSTQILAHLRKGKSLTVLTALQKFGCFSLSQRCTEMIRAGVPIKAEFVTLKNGKKIKSYSI